MPKRSADSTVEVRLTKWVQWRTPLALLARRPELCPKPSTNSQTSSTVGDLLEHSGRREGPAAVVLLAPHCEGLPTIDGQSLPVPVLSEP